MLNIEFLVATTHRENTDFIKDMNIQAPAIVTNQAGHFAIEKNENLVMITTNTKGVGINRNIGLHLTKKDYVFISDDDMVYYDEAIQIIEQASVSHPDADIIIFGFDYFKENKFLRPRMRKNEKINILNCLNYGICCTLIKVESIRKYNIDFSTLFGGGCRYSCGEDSLFFLDCVRKKLNIYADAKPIGKNEYRESTWFKGYNEKFFFDKGAWIACAFPKSKWFMKWYFIFRFQKLSTISTKSMIHYINSGIKGFQHGQAYEGE